MKDTLDEVKIEEKRSSCGTLQSHEEKGASTKGAKEEDALHAQEVGWGAKPRLGVEVLRVPERVPKKALAFNLGFLTWGVSE